MKKDFKEYYDYNTVELKNLWNEAIFIFDTNILHSLYRLPEDSRNELIKLLNKLKDQDRIWAPHQVLLEYHRNRRGVILGLESDYNDAVHAIEGLIAELPKKVEAKLKSACENHPLLNFEDFYKDAEKSLEGITKKIKDIKNTKHPDWKSKDVILKDIENIFSSYGNKYNKKELDEILKKGETRYKDCVPPGYKDCKNHGGEKSGEEKFGDLIIWKQILDYAKKENKSIIFVTNDSKEDWWEIENGRIVKARVELKKEFIDHVSKRIEMYDLSMFLDKANELLKTNMATKQINIIKEAEERRIANNYLGRIGHKISPVLSEKDLYNDYTVSLSRFIRSIKGSKGAHLYMEHPESIEFLNVHFRFLRNNLNHSKITPFIIDNFYRQSNKAERIMKHILHSEDLTHEISFNLTKTLEKLEKLIDHTQKIQ